MTLNEADTRAKLIDPKLYAAGSGEDRIQREHKSSSTMDGENFRFAPEGEGIRAEA